MISRVGTARHFVYIPCRLFSRTARGRVSCIDTLLQFFAQFHQIRVSIHDTQRKEDTWGPRRTICSRNSEGVFLLRCGPTGAGAYAARRRRRRKHSANVHFARLQGINPWPPCRLWADIRSAEGENKIDNPYLIGYNLNRRREKCDKTFCGATFLSK